MKDRIQALLDKGITYHDITCAIRDAGGSYQGTYNFMAGKTIEPTRLSLEELDEGLKLLEIRK